MLRTTYRHIGWLAIAVSLLLPACSPRSPHARAGDAALAVRPTVSGQSFWQQALLAPEDQRAALYLQAASRFLASGQLTWAQRALTAVSLLALTDTQEHRFAVLRASSLVQAHRYREAAQVLPHWSEVRDGWSQDLRKQWCQLQTTITQGRGQLTEQVIAWQRLADQYPANQPEYQQALSRLWRTLVAQPVPVLRHAQRALVPGSVVAGWFDLAVLVATQGYWSDDALQAWTSRYPHHPAQALLDRKKQTLPWRRVKKVALLLPLSGRFGEQGQAIRRGFYAAYYNQSKTAHAVLPEVMLYDTASGSIKAIARKAQRDGASLLMGPLLKQQVKALVSAGISQPTLAFNTIDQIDPMLYQFALDPTVAAGMIADRLAREGRWHVAIMMDDTPWAKRMAASFKARWTALDGVVVATLAVPEKGSRALSASMKRLLHISASIKRERQVAKAVGKRLRFVPSRREDVDAIVLFARQQDAQQIRPFLRYYFAGDVPVYAGPSVYDRRSTVSSKGDLNGIQFLSTPWQVLPASSLPPTVALARRQIKQSWPKIAVKQARFFAMGVDAFSLMTRLPWLVAIPDLSFFGGTGILSIGDHQRIKRQLTWARFSRGYVKPVHVPL